MPAVLESTARRTRIARPPCTARYAGDATHAPVSAEAAVAVSRATPSPTPDRNGHDTGYRMRMRSSHVDASSGGTVNSTTRGAWKYFVSTE